MNHSEQRAGDVEFGCTEMPDADSKMMDKVALSPETLPEGRCSKRVADDENLHHTPYSLTKKIKLDEHLVNNVSIQEHWKKEALSNRSREMLVDASDSGDKEVAEGSKELFLRVDSLDAAIRHDEVALSKLHNSLGNPNESVNKDNGELEVEVGGNVEELKPHLNCLEQVLIENQRKAEASHALLDKMMKSVTGSFLYRQPCDTAVYHENKQKFMTFKKKLVAYLKNRDETQQLRSENLSKQWNRLYHAWKKKTETVEGHQNQKYCSSGLQAFEQNCTVDALNVDAEVMKKLSLIVPPPPLLDSRVSQLGLLSANGNVEESVRLNSTSTLKCSTWTDHEHETLIKKYTQNPKKLVLLASLLEDKNNTKEEKGENENFTMKPSGRRLLPLDKELGISSRRINASDVELGDDTARLSGMENPDEPGLNRRSLSLPEHFVSHLPSNSSESSLTRTIRAYGKFREADVFPKTSDQLGNVPDHPHPMEEGGRVDDIHESDKAAADEDNESTATLSAEEADGHCPDDDDNLTDKTPSFKPSQAAGKRENILGMKMQEYGLEHLRAEVNCSEAPRFQWFLPPVILEEQLRHPSTDRDERKNYNATSASVRPSSAPKRKNESLRSVRSAAKDVVDGRIAKAITELLPSNPPAAPEGHSQVSYSPAPVNHFSGGQVTVRAPVPSVFSRNTRSPTRIRDLIHAAIEKNLAIDNKTDLVASSRNDAWQIRQTGNLNYKPPSSSSLLDMENAEVQDLSIRTSRCASSSSSKVTSTTAGKTPVQPAALYHYPNVDSSCHPRPAHAHRSDPRAGSLLDLADAAEYERLRQLERERQQAAADRDGSFKQFETSAPEMPFGLNLPAQAWRQREESGHTGSTTQLTPVSIAPHYRFQNSQQTADAYIEGLEIHPTAVGHSMEIQCEPASWHRPTYPQVVPQSSTELLHNDILTAQQILTFQGSSLHLQPYRPHQNVPPRTSPATRHDARATRPCRPPGAAQLAQRFSGTDGTSWRVQAEPTVTGGGGGQKVNSGWRGGSPRVPSSFRNSPLETVCGKLPSAVQADKNPKPNATSAPFRPYKPDPLGLHRISAAQLIEEIINTQINRPDGGNKVQSSSILSQIDYEINPASYDDSVFAHVPTALKSNRNGSEHVVPRTSSKSAVPEKAAELNGKRTGRSSIPSTEAHDQLFNSDMNIHRRDAELPVPKKSCISHTMASNLLSLSSGTIQDTGTFPFNVTNVNSEDMSLYSGQVKKPTVNESIDVIVGGDTRPGSRQNPLGDACFTTRNYIAGSDLTQRVNSQKREDLGKESGINCSSSSQRASVDKANSFSSDEPKLKENQEDASKNSCSSSSRQFNWKMRLLKEHQKQLVEQEDQGQTIQNSSGIGRKISDSQSCQTPSSEILLPLNNQEGSSVVQSDAASYPTSRLSSPNGAQCSLGSSVACVVVGEDHHSAIAATHQMMSTLLSTRSGCQLGMPPSSSDPVLPVQPDPLHLKPATACDSVLKKAVTSEQEEVQMHNSPIAAEPESPGSDSQGSDRSGRLVIRMDSAEDWKSP